VDWQSVGLVQAERNRHAMNNAAALVVSVRRARVVRLPRPFERRAVGQGEGRRRGRAVEKSVG